MMLPITSRIADAVVAEINDAVAASSFETVGFTAERRLFDWDLDFTGLSDLTVEVVFVTRHTKEDEAIRLNSAGSIKYPIKIDVVVMKRFREDEQDPKTGRLKVTVVDPLVRLIEQIQELFVSQRNSIPLSDVEEANWVSVEPYWINQPMMRLGLFQGSVRLSFDYTKDI